MHSNQVCLQNSQLRLILIIIQWLFAFLFPISFIYLDPQLKYDSISYVCVFSTDNNSILMIVVTLIDGIFPFTLITLIYMKLFIYIRRVGRTSTLVFCAFFSSLLRLNNIALNNTTKFTFGFTRKSIDINENQRHSSISFYFTSINENDLVRERERKKKK